MTKRPTEWEGPGDELMPDGYSLRRPLPGNRWPYGPASAHDDGCNLHRGGLFCDCQASAAEGDEDA